MSSEQQPNPQTGEARASYEPCLCRETVDHFRKLFRLSPGVVQHLTNSRIEFLKAVETLISERIEHLSSTPQQGTKIPVE